MSKEPRPLAEMEEIAGRFIEAIRPSCTRVDIAGSIRRKKALVGDIEIVATPATVYTGLFGDMPTSALFGTILELELRGTLRFTKGDTSDARYHQVVLTGGQQIDIFLAEGDNWGWIHLLRTGSAGFSQGMLMRWKERQGIFQDGKGSAHGRLVTRDGATVPTPSEDDVFRLCQLPYRPPEERTDENAWRWSSPWHNA